MSAHAYLGLREQKPDRPPIARAELVEGNLLLQVRAPMKDGAEAPCRIDELPALLKLMRDRLPKP